LLYTVENQDDALRIAQLAVEEFGGIDGAESIEDLFDMSNEFSGAIKTFIVGSVLNDAYRLAKKAEKGSEEQKRYEDVVEKASNLLAERARENGREIAALYKLYLTSPEGMYTIEAKKFLQDVQSRFGTKKQQEKIDKLTKELIDAKAEAARLAANSESVQAAVEAATGGPTTGRPNKPKAPSDKPVKPRNKPDKPLTDTQENLKKERSLFQQLRDKLKSLGNTRARRQYPAGVDPDIVDILSGLARVNFKRGIFDYFDIKKVISDKLAKENLTISDDHYSEMWSDMAAEARSEEVTYNAKILAERIVDKAKMTPPTSPAMTKVMKLIKDELFKRATQDIKDFDVDNETEFDKLRRLLFVYDSYTNPIWQESKDAVTRQIDELDPAKFSASAKARLKRDLDSFYSDTIANLIPRSQKKITATFAEEVKAKEFKIQEILLMPNENQAGSAEEFVTNLVDRLISGTNMSYQEAQTIADAFLKEYDALAQKTAEKILARSVPKMKNSAKILRKSSAERAFEMIKYGAVEIDAELTDKDGNLTDLNVLFAEIFGLPQMTAEIRQNLKDFAEQIAKTKPNSILRQQFYNDMMSYIEFQKIRDVSVGSILLAQIYNNVLFSWDTMTKAFNSNIILMPTEFLTQTLRAAADGDFRLIPLMAKSFFGRKGDKNTEVWFKEGFNNAKLALAGMVQTENFSTTNIAETMSKQNDSPALKAWGKFARKSGRYLGALDTLLTAAATQARVSDLMYDEIKYQAKLNGIKLTNKQIAESVANIQGIKFKPDNSPVADAITQANEEFIEAYGPNVDWNDNTKLALYRARVMEIVREGASERAIKYFKDQGINLKLEASTIEDIKSLARELASKVGLMGTPPGSWGVLSTILQIPGMFYPGSQAILGNMFAKAPMNAAEKILQGNTLIGGIVLAIRLTKNQRGLVTSSEVTTRFYDSFGIRTEMYGRTTSRLGGVIDINMEKKELIARYVMVQAAVLPISYFAVTAITGAIAGALGSDDDDIKEDIIKDGILGLSKLSEDKRQMLFFGDKTAPVGSKRYEGQWKKLGLYVTGPMYGYTAPGAYSKMTALKSMYGIEPYSIYVYGRLITRYNDNPFIASIFGSVGANSDVALFNNDPEKPTETFTDMVMMTSFLQMSLVKDQAAIKPLMEWVDAVSAKGVYSAPELDKLGDRAALVIQKKLANLASNIVLPAAVKNFNQNMKSIMGEAAMDPRGFREFLVVRVPILDLLIKNEKTDHFGFPIEEKTKLVLPVGTQGLMYAFNPDGKLTFPQVDQIMTGPGGKYYSMFKKYNNDKYNNPDITSYIERNSNNSGESKVVKLNLDQLTQVRDEYKIIMRKFIDKKYNTLKSGSNELMFQNELDQFLGLYKGNIMGYKGYIIKKLFGKNAYVNLTTEELTEDALDKIKPVN
jgi:polyhydroxyalkanoate synthesis regulator phasin